MMKFYNYNIKRLPVNPLLFFLMLSISLSSHFNYFNIIPPYSNHFIIQFHFILLNLAKHLPIMRLKLFFAPKNLHN